MKDINWTYEEVDLIEIKHVQIMKDINWTYELISVNDYKQVRPSLPV